MNRFLTILTACTLAAPTLGNDEKPEAAQTDFTVVTAKRFTFEYRVENGNLIARVSCSTKGWIAVGFNPSKRMKDANLIIGSVSDGVQTVEDHFGVTATEHQDDTRIGGQADIIESSCTEVDGTTTLAFTIPLDSGDSRDGIIRQGQDTKVIFASGKKDSFGTKHFAYAKTKIRF